MESVKIEMKHDYRHGNAYDRGSADAYYGRPYNPHYYVGATYSSERITKESMTEWELNSYDAGYQDQANSGDFKDWG